MAQTTVSPIPTPGNTPPVFCYRNTNGDYLTARDINDRVDIAVETLFGIIEPCNNQLATPSKLTLEAAGLFRLILAGSMSAANTLDGVAYWPDAGTTKEGAA